MAESLRYDNILSYIQENYGEIKSIEKRTVPAIQSFLQDDFEGASDCTLTSILTVTNYFTEIEKPLDCYNFIKKIAKKVFYTDNHGTFATTINFIVKRVFKNYGIKYKPRARFFKGIFVKPKYIKDNIDHRKPVLLSLWKDGRGYYDNHTITIIGYGVYTTIDQKEHFILQIYDNWSKQLRYLDYEKLSIICSINYFSD